MNHPSIIEQMSLEEKIALCSGADFWHTKALERLGIPAILMNRADGMEAQLKEFLSMPGSAQLVVECPAEANVYPMVPAGAALTDMVWEEKKS